MVTKNEATTNGFMGYMNLHDAYLNASLARSHMLRSPIVDDSVSLFTASDRGRFERVWVTFLYVLVEAWRSDLNLTTRAYISLATDTQVVDGLIALGQSDGRLAKMKNVRDYMCHRDRREYWDEGRTDVAGQLDYHEKLHCAFGLVFRRASSYYRGKG